MRDFSTFPINPCQNVVFDLIIRVAMITLNMRINISYKTFGNCTTIGRILIKIKIHWPKIFINVVLYFSEVDKLPFTNDAFFPSIMVKKSSVNLLINSLQNPNIQSPGSLSIVFKAFTRICSSFNS